MKRSHSRLVLSAIALLFASGCAATGTKKADTTSNTLHEAAQSVARSNAQITPVLAALSELVNNPNVDAATEFRKFSSGVAELESLAGQVNAQATAMKEQGSTYFVTWNAELAKIQNEDIRTRSLERKDEVNARFERVNASYAQTNADFAPFLSDLVDIRTLLGTDLTAGGVASVRGVANRAQRDAEPLRVSLGRLAEEFESLGVSLAATTPQA